MAVTPLKPSDELAGALGNGGTGGGAAPYISATEPENPTLKPIWINPTESPRVLRIWDGSGWLEFESTGGGETVAPTFLSAEINTDGDTLTVVLTEEGSPPIQPASGITGFSISGGDGQTIGEGTRVSDTTIEFPIEESEVIADGDTISLEYDDSIGNVTDSANVPNPLASFGPVLVDNGSEVEPAGDPEDVAIGGTASSSTEPGIAPDAFDKNTGTWWGAGGNAPQWLKYDLGSGNAQVAVGYRVRTAIATYPSAYQFQGSNDNSSWDTLHTQASFSPSGNTWYDYEFTNSTAYRYYRLLITEGDYPVVGELEIMA